MTPYYDHAGITIYHGDCREVLPTLEPVDLVLTDPPYGIGDKWARQGTVMSGGKWNTSSRLWGQGEDWDDKPADQDIINGLCSGKAIIWGGNYFHLPPSPSWLVWDKAQKFSGNDAELAWSNVGCPLRVFRLSRVAAFGKHRKGDLKEHPTQKPSELMKWCIDLSSTSGPIVDPFMGSGTTLRAAKDLGRKAIGIEIEEKYCEIAARRLAQEVLF